MGEVIRFFQEVANQMPDYPRYLHFVVIIAIVIATQLIKLPIKKFAISKIKNEAVRQKVNMVFMILPNGLGMCASAILMLFDYRFSWEAGLMWGTCSQVIYEFIERIVKRIAKKKDLAEITQDEIAEDFKQAQKDAEAKTKQAGKEFEELVKQIKGE